MENKTEFDINDLTLILNVELESGDGLKIELVDEKTVLYGTYIGLNDDYELIFILCNGIEMEIDPDFIKRITLDIQCGKPHFNERVLQSETENDS